MQSNINKSKENITNVSNTEIDTLLLENQEIFKQLISETLSRKDKTYMLVKEYDLIKKFEQNLILLLEKCPPNKVNEILTLISNSDMD